MRRSSTSREDLGIILIIALVLCLTALTWYMATTGAAQNANNVANIWQDIAWMLVAIVIAIILWRAWTQHKRPQLILETLTACGANGSTAFSGEPTAANLAYAWAVWYINNKSARELNTRQGNETNRAGAARGPAAGGPAPAQTPPARMNVWQRLTNVLSGI